MPGTRKKRLYRDVSRSSEEKFNSASKELVSLSISQVPLLPKKLGLPLWTHTESAPGCTRKWETTRRLAVIYRCSSECVYAHAVVIANGIRNTGNPRFAWPGSAITAHVTGSPSQRHNVTTCVQRWGRALHSRPSLASFLST